MTGPVSYGRCPVCDRDLAMKRRAVGLVMRLHNAPGGGYCPGSGQPPEGR